MKNLEQLKIDAFIKIIDGLIELGNYLVASGFTQSQELDEIKEKVLRLQKALE